jgi:hypothetical protein
MGQWLSVDSFIRRDHANSAQNNRAVNSPHFKDRRLVGLRIGKLVQVHVG